MAAREPPEIQGRIKVCGGPRLDTFTGPRGPTLLFISYRHLPALRVRGIIPGKYRRVTDGNANT